MIKESSKIRYLSYDFKSIKASVGRNAIHDYPAMLHSKLVESLLIEFGSDDKIVFDPFCGSGTTVIQSLQAGMSVIGTDINPLALLIATVRSSNVDIQKALTYLDELKNNYYLFEEDVPQVTNIDYWFKDNIIKDLGKIRRFISALKEDDLRYFYLVTFSNTIRYVSNNKRGEFKRCRLANDKLILHSPKVMQVFEEILRRNLQIINNSTLTNHAYRLFLADSGKPLPFSDRIDFVLTSPPYGDSRTTVAYGQFSSFGLEWIKGLNPFGDADLSLDREGLGGKSPKQLFYDVSEILKKVSIEIYHLDRKRAYDISSFFRDLYKCCQNIAGKLNKDATICFVVGNRTVKGIQIPMDEIIVDFFESLGLRHLETRVREISNKRMPSMNSPSNISGITAPTMKEEYIVLFKGS